MTGLLRRTACLGDTAVVIELPANAATERVVDIVLDGSGGRCLTGRSGRRMQGHLHHGPRPTLRIEQIAADRWRLRGAGPAIEAHGAGHLAHLVMDEVARQLTADCRRGLLFHAAAIRCGRGVVVIPGGSGAGKSTLAASLVRRGFTLIGDEIAHVDESRVVRSYPRPFAFKPNGMALVTRWIGSVGADGATLDTPAATLVPSRLVGCSDRISAWPAAAFVFPARAAGGGTALVPMSRGETALTLMASLLNARLRPAHGFPEVVELARDVPGYRLHYPDGDEVPCDWLATSSA